MMTISNDDIYAATIAVLSKLIDMDKKSSGSTRSGGDYSREAMALVDKMKQQLNL